MDKEKPLTAKQKRFVEEYLLDFNGTQAAVRAGYAFKSAPVIASENLRKPNVQKYINQRREELSNMNQVEKSDVIRRLTQIAFCNSPDFFGVTVEEWEKLTVKERMNKENVRKRQQSKTLETLGKHYGIFGRNTDDNLPVVNNVYNFTSKSDEELE
jgi:phage terminase small subunit